MSIKNITANPRQHGRLWTPANLCTFSRVLLLPLLIITFATERFLASVVLVGLIGASDIADGWIARRTNTASNLGAIFDVAADSIVVFSFQVFLVVSGDWPPVLLFLNFVSLGTFLLGAGRARKVTKKAIGQYMGAVSVALFMLAAIAHAISPVFWEQLIRVLGPPVVVYSLASVGENVSAIRTSQTPGGCQ